MNIKAILIARVSTEEQKEAGNSLPAQVARLERYCKGKNLPILKTYSLDESAYKEDREKFDRILDEILSHTDKIAVCCDKVDRLSRNMFDKRISELYEKALLDEIELHFASDGQIVNSRISAAEKFHFSISLGLAKYYSDAISDNVKRSIEGKLRKGEWIAKAPYGYKHVKEENGISNIVINESEAYIVKKTFEYYASGAYSLELLTKKVNTEFNVKWTRSFVDKMLKKPFYHGTMLVKGKEYPHKYEPIISQELFDSVQQRKAGFNKQKFKYAGKPYIYRGLIRCADCGLTVTPEKHKGHIYYHCTEYNGKHGAKWLREEELTKQIGSIFKRMQIPQEILHQVTSALQESHKNKIDYQKNLFDKLTSKQKKLTTMMDNLYIDKLQNRITDDHYDRFYDKFKKESEQITLQLGKLQQAETNYYATAKCILDLANCSYDLFKSSEVEEKRALIKFVLQNLQLKDKNIVWEAHKPFDLILKSADCIQWRP